MVDAESDHEESEFRVPDGCGKLPPFDAADGEVEQNCAEQDSRDQKPAATRFDRGRNEAGGLRTRPGGRSVYGVFDSRVPLIGVDAFLT
jgi:hypothetical protein